MAGNQDIIDMRGTVKELREDLHKLREKVTTDVNSAFGISRDLHQKQALSVARLEVRIEAIDNQVTQVLRILQGDGTHTGVVGRIELWEQMVSGVVDLNKTQDDSLQILQNKSYPCEHNLNLIQGTFTKVEEIQRKVEGLDEKQKEQGKELKVLQNKEAQLRGGWIALGVAVGVTSGLIALVLQLWKFFNP